MRVKNTASCSSSNFDEAHETGHSDFIFLMRFPCAEKSDDGKRDGQKKEGLAGQRSLTAEEDGPHPLVGQLQRQGGQTEGRGHG